MEEEDDLFVVIIENDKGEDGNFPIPIITKQEQLDETETKLAIEDILATAEKHGQFINIGSQSVCNEYEYLDDEDVSLEKPGKETLEGSPELKKKSATHDNCEISHSSLANKRRYKLKPGEQKSFVADLRDQYPELRKDKKLLVSTLAVIMGNVKPAPPPDNYCVFVDNVYVCTQCDASTETIPAACRHYQEKHGPRYLMCYACGVDFRSATNLYKHEKRCSAPDARVVLQARATCIGSKGRSRPYLNLRKNAPPKFQSRFDCKLCSASFNTKHNLTSHEYMHKGERPFQCHVCPAAYTNKSVLSRHMSKHSNVEYICDHCGRSFKIKMTLIAHLNTHQPQRKFGCAECERRFAQKSALQLHVDRVHRNLPPPCACQICPKRYPRMSLLKKHMKSEHGLVIMTRKMFFKQLPMLSSSEIQQVAKLVFRNDTNLPEENIDEQQYNVHKEEPIDSEDDKSTRDEVIVPDNLSPGDIIELLNRFQSTNRENKMIIENGQIMNLHPDLL